MTGLRSFPLNVPGNFSAAAPIARGPSSPAHRSRPGLIPRSPRGWCPPGTPRPAVPATPGPGRAAAVAARLAPLHVPALARGRWLRARSLPPAPARPPRAAAARSAPAHAPAPRCRCSGRRRASGGPWAEGHSPAEVPVSGAPRRLRAAGGTGERPGSAPPHGRSRGRAHAVPGLGCPRTAGSDQAQRYGRESQAVSCRHPELRDQIILLYFNLVFRIPCKTRPALFVRLNLTAGPELSYLLKIGGKDSRWNPDLTLPESGGHGKPAGNYSCLRIKHIYTLWRMRISFFCCTSVPHPQDVGNRYFLSQILALSLLSYYKSLALCIYIISWT